MLSSFKPVTYLKNPYIQTILASSKFRVKGVRQLEKKEKKVIFDVLGGIKLYGLYSAQKNSKGIVILLHGWEGSSGSTYIKHTGRYMYDNGYSVFRLNCRDHGDSHYLNEGIFYASFLDEVFDGIRQAALLEKYSPAFIIGFSLGGNFALRTAVKNSSYPIPNLKHIVSVSPGLVPATSTDAIDKEWLLKKYFLKKWKKSLRKKEKLYPGLYNFKRILKIKTCRELTDELLKECSEYSSLSEYFDEYTIKDDNLKSISCPTTIIVAKDDPIISVEDFYNLRLNQHIDLIVHENGGHNGFIENLFGPAWYAKKSLEIFNGKVEP